MITSFIIPSIDRPTLGRAKMSVYNATGEFPLCEIDTERIGPGEIRNRLIKQADTEWVSFLDDDDTITLDYVDRLKEEIAAHPEADVIHFTQYFVEQRLIFPHWPTVNFENIGIGFSVKRELALKHPFKSEPHEDYHFVKRLADEGYNVFFSKYCVYRVRH